MLSNSTNITNNTDELTHTLLIIDQCIRVYVLLVHVVYFIIVLRVKEFRAISFILVHHVNFVGFLFALLYCLYINSTLPNTGYLKIDRVLCTASEITWALIKYMQSNSLLMVATHRYLGVFKINLYRKLNKSRSRIIIVIGSMWLIALLLVISSKFIFDTKPGKVFCFDGFSAHLENSIYYLFFPGVIGVLLPNVTLIVFYIRIFTKLNRLALKTGRKRQSNFIRTDTSDQSSDLSKIKSTQEKAQSFKSFQLSIKRKLSNDFLSTKYRNKNEPKDKRGERSRAKMLITMSITITLISLSFLFMSTANIFVHFKDKWLKCALIGRIITLLLQSLIPIFSLIFHPAVSKFFSTLFVSSQIIQGKIDVSRSLK